MQLQHEVLDFSGLDRNEIDELLKCHQLALSVDEALAIQQDILKRPPTFSECVLWSIQGSEHCSYRSTRKYLKTMMTDGPNVILGAKEDAGIVAVAKDDTGLRYGIVMSHESHNHPSQVVPYEGAATGVGGNVRDVSCMGAEVIALADGLRFGDLSRPKTSFIYHGVVAGIGGYGNPIGVPNIAGDVYYDKAYNDNCLVTVVTLGIVREDQVIHSYAPKNAEGFVYILVGKATDNSGFGGASFASQTLNEDKETQNKGAVQEPNAFLKRHLLKANQSLFEKLSAHGLIHQVGFKDLGAGGIACATVELADAAGYGAEIILDHVPTSMDGLKPAVVLCSETQERFMWVVPPEQSEMILEHYNKTYALPEISKGAAATVIGHVRGDGQYVVHAQGTCIVNARAKDITRGIVSERAVEPVSYDGVEPKLSDVSCHELLLKLLSHENIASRAPILETYDKQVQGRTLIESGMANAGVLTPFNEEKYPLVLQKVGVALSVAQNPRYNMISPYWGAVNAVVESARKVCSVGASPVAITDCLCFGNPEKPEVMWAFTESVRGIIDSTKVIGLKEYPDASLPIIAGNVSLYNDTVEGAIPPSPMISCLGTIPDATFAITPAFKKSGSLLVMCGERKDECGGSVYYQLQGELGALLPKPCFKTLRSELQAVSEVIQKGLVLAVGDVALGGIAVTLAKMSFGNNIGLDVEIPGTLPVAKCLFSESGGFVLEVRDEDWVDCQAVFTSYSVPLTIIGRTIDAAILHMQQQIHLPIAEAKALWSDSLREKLL